MKQANGTIIGDGSWNLSILITDLNISKSLRVRSDMHVGGVILKLVQEVVVKHIRDAPSLAADIQRDWSDHALWWPKKNRWLKHTRLTLDHWGVSAESQLFFTPMHKACRVQLPDLQYIDVCLDFSVPAFDACLQLGSELGIRHPEELSLKRLIDPESLKRSTPAVEPQLASQVRDSPSSLNLARSPGRQTKPPTGDQPSPASPDRRFPLTQTNQNLSPSRPIGGTLPPSPHHNPAAAAIKPSRQYFTLTGTGGLPPQQYALAYEGLVEFEESFAETPISSVPDALGKMLKPRNYAQKANLNRGWLDSSRPLMEQGIMEHDTVLLRFKYLSFFDLNPAYDPVRLNQIYEQAKWAVLSEQIDCTDEEALLFAALQRQIEQRKESRDSEGHDTRGPGSKDVEAALDELETTLEGVNFAVGFAANGLSAGPDITQIPELADYLRYMRPKKFGLRTWKRAYFTFRDLSIHYYATVGDSHHGQPQGRVFLKGAEVNPDVSIKDGRFVIKLLIPTADGMSDFALRCDSEAQYIKWMAGCKVAARGRSMADASYPAEVEALRRLLDMQHPTMAPSVQHASRNGHEVRGAAEISPDDYLPQRVLRKLESRHQLAHRIAEAQRNVSKLSARDAKMHYIRAWQALPEFGLHYFVVQFKGAKKQELIAIASNRLMRMNLDTGYTYKTWRFANIKSWHVNWEIKCVMLVLDDEELIFSCLSADCKVPHEFIGGYIFLSLRSKDGNTNLDSKLFHKLTSGPVENPSISVQPLGVFP